MSGDAKGDDYSFFATFGTGQPNFPGYFRVDVRGAESPVEARTRAHVAMNRATNQRWSFLYGSYEELHVLDRVYRGSLNG